RAPRETTGREAHRAGRAAYAAGPASPALYGLTPAFAAVAMPTNIAPRPSEVIIIPGSRSARYDPSAGTADRRYRPPAPTRLPTTINGRVPMRFISCEETPAETATPAVNGR